MWRRFEKLLTRLLLGPADGAGRQVLDKDARLALAPRVLDRELHAPSETYPPRRVGRFLVYEGGRQMPGGAADGPFGRPSRITVSGRQASAGDR